jgi:hypothetical protein
MAENKNHNSEFEVKLVVASRQPREIASSLKKLTRVGDYRLGNRQVIKIRDIYFDTGIDTLRKNQLALRARSTENKKLLTLKGRAAIADWGGIKRLEIEETWSVSSLQKILERIPDLNFDPNFLFAIFLPDNPVKTLEKLDFIIVQDRITQREMRDVVIQGSHESLADFVIDEVHFQTSAGKVIHYEVEIEALAEKYIEHVHNLLKELQTRYPDDLRIWLYSKLETGEVIYQHANDLKKNSFITKSNFISKDGYKKIADLLYKK